MDNAMWANVAAILKKMDAEADECLASLANIRLEGHALTVELDALTTSFKEHSAAVGAFLLDVHNHSPVKHGR